MVEEAADALGFFANEQRALITACRQLLSRQPGVGPLWWLCNRLVLSKDPRAEASLVLEECWNFSPSGHLESIGMDPGAVIVVHTDAAGVDAGELDTGRKGGGRGASRSALVSVDTIQQIDEAHSTGLAVWIVMGPGVWLPTMVWEEVKERCGADQRNDWTIVDLDRMTGIHTPDGKIAPDQLGPSTMPVAPELLVRLN